MATDKVLVGSSAMVWSEFGFKVQTFIYQIPNYINNTSTIDITHELVFDSGVSYRITGGSLGGAIVIDGNSYNYSSRNSSGTNSPYILGNGSIGGIKHDAYGNKTITVSCTDYHTIWTSKMGSNESMTLGKFINNKVVKLNAITKAAKITSAPNFTDEDNPTILYSNPLGNQVSSVNIGIANTNGILVVPYKDVSLVGSSYTFNFTDEERDALRKLTTSSTTATVRIYIQTVYNGVLYWNYVSRTLTIANANPVITASVKDINTTTVLLTGNPNKLVKYYSTAQAEMSAEGRKGAAINLDTLIIRNGGVPEFSSPAIFENVESNVFNFGIGDSRGATTSLVLTPEMIEYIRLTCNIDRGELDANGGLLINCSGSYFNQSFGNYSNTLTVQCRYKEQDGEYGNWLEMNATPRDDNTYRASITVPDLNYREKYIIQCRAIDRLSDAETAEMTIKSFPVFHWSENDFVFEVPVKFNAGVEGADINTEGEGSSSNNGMIDGNATITGDCVINGNLRLKGAGNYGNTIYFGDASYAMISEPSDDTLQIKATRIDLNGSVNVNGGSLTSGSWLPTLNNSSAVSSYSVRQGWYQRIGNVITIGWQLKATINSGYSSSSLSISGVPATPLYAAFGGGVAHNINVSAGFNFEGWTIDTSGNISPRTQPCNGTSAGNLQISSTAYYPSGSGNVLTLAGTICYVAN